jgi:pimeloyl-ACP methyl ester carboxylesterase
MSDAPLVRLRGANDPSPADDPLARQFRVVAVDTPSQPGTEAASAVERALDGLSDFDLIASGDSSAAALWLALARPERVRALVLESPTAIGRDAELERRLPEITTPTLVLFGTSDRAAAQDTGRVYTKLIPNSHLVFVYDAKEAIGRDRPEAFAEVVADFLERHEAFIINRTPTVIHP